MSNFFKQFRILLLSQFREFYREPEVLFWTFAFPIGIAWVLGIAFSGESEQHRNIAWIKHNTKDSLTFLEKSASATGLKLTKDSTSGNFIMRLGSHNEGFSNLRFIPAGNSDAELMVKKGKAALIIEDYQDSIQYRFDPGNSDAHSTYLLISSYLSGRKEKTQSIKKLEAPGLRYIDFFLPGLIGMGIMSSALWGISFSLIEKRSKKLLRRMVATPMSKSAFLSSIIVGRMILSFIENVILFLFAKIYFSTVITGSLAALLIVFLAGNLFFSGVAILVSSRTAKSQVGNGLINAITMPMSICSGIFFSYHNFPDWLVPFIKVLPLTVLADDLRSIFIEGAGIAEIIPGTMILTLCGILITVIGIKIYKWY